jgi:hypothetical protein
MHARQHHALPRGLAGNGADDPSALSRKHCERSPPPSLGQDPRLLADAMEQGRLGVANRMEGIDPRSVGVVHVPEKSMHIRWKPHEPSRLPRPTVPRNRCSNSAYTASKRGPLPLTLSERLESWRSSRSIRCSAASTCRARSARRAPSAEHSAVECALVAVSRHPAATAPAPASGSVRSSPASPGLGMVRSTRAGLPATTV